MTKLLSTFTVLLLLSAISSVDAAKTWRVATPYPGNYEQKDPIRNMPDGPQSRMQKHMAQMKTVFDPKKRQGDNKNEEKANAKLKRQAKMTPKKDVKRTIPPKLRMPLFTFPGQDRKKKNSLAQDLIPSTSWYNS